MLKRVLLLAVAVLCLNLPAHGQAYVRLIGGQQDAVPPVPASSSNPVPVTNTPTGTQDINITKVSGATPSASNPLAIRLSVDGTNYMDATHGGYVNILQGNAVTSLSNPLFVSPQFTTAANLSSQTGNVANSSTTITLAHTARYITFKTDPTAAICYVCPGGGTCTSTAGFRVEPGAAYSWSTSDGQTTFTYIGATSTGTYSAGGN